MLGVTGGIGAGKSTVAAMLAERGAVVIDTDVVARDVASPGGRAFEAIVDRFGSDLALDRAALGRVVFADPMARASLNALVHPAVESVVRERLSSLPDDAVVVLEVPLLVEAGWDRLVSLVVVVDCPVDVAVRRLVGDRGMSEADARARVAAQASREERLARADVVLVNDGSLTDLSRQVDSLWEALLLRTGDGLVGPEPPYRHRFEARPGDPEGEGVAPG